jgi:hypothetical protein
VVREQLDLLADAREHWYRAEARTVLEMEQLARALDSRECSLNARAARLIRADELRRGIAHALWRRQLELETWQTKLTAMAMWRDANKHPHLEAQEGVPSGELTVLRDEIERLTASVLEIELPDPPEESGPTRPAEGPKAPPREPLQLGDARAA